MLIQAGKGLFLFFLHDKWTAAFLRMLTVEQFKSDEISHLYSEQYFDGPLAYQAQMLGMLTEDCEIPYIKTYAIGIQAANRKGVSEKKKEKDNTACKAAFVG